MTAIRTLGEGVKVMFKAIIIFILLLSAAILFYIGKWHPHDSQPKPTWNVQSECLTEGDGLCY